MSIITEDYQTVLHKGSNSSIYLVNDKVLGRCLVKVKHKSNNQHYTYNEYDILKNYSSRYARKVLRKGLFKNEPAVWLEYIEGVTLLDYLSYYSDKLYFSEWLDIAIELCRGVADMHKYHIVHKNITCNNIIINNHNKVTWIDFEQAEKYSDYMSLGSISDSDSLKYIAPEQLGGGIGKVGFRSDLYALGVVFFRMLTGYFPFEYDQNKDLISAHLNEYPLSLNSYDKSIPDVIGRLVMKLLAKSPEDRYQSAEGLLADLKICKRTYQKKGKIEGINIGEKDFSFIFKQKDRLYGRVEELKLIKEKYNKVVKDGFQGVLLRGSVGVGKSRLVNTFLGDFLGGNYLVVSSEGCSSYKEIPYYIVVESLQGAVNTILSDDNRELYAKVISETLDPEKKAILKAVIPELGLLLRRDGYSKTNVVLNEVLLNVALVAFIKALCNVGYSVIWFLDDLHWADKYSVGFLSYMADVMDEESLFLVGVYQDETTAYSLEELSDKNNVITHEITGLELSAIQRMLSDWFGASLEEVRYLSERIEQASQGNPSYIHRLMDRMYFDNTVYFSSIVRKWRWQVEGFEEIVHSSLKRKIVLTVYNELSFGAKRLLNVAVCLGGNFDKKTLSIVEGVSDFEVSELLNEAVRLKLIAPVIRSKRHQNIDESNEIQFYFTDRSLALLLENDLGANQKSAINYKIAVAFLKTAFSDRQGDLMCWLYLSNYALKSKRFFLKNASSDFLIQFFETFKKANKVGSSFLVHQYAILFKAVSLLQRKDLALNIGSSSLLTDIMFNTNVVKHELYNHLFDTTKNKYQQLSLLQKRIEYLKNENALDEAFNVGVFALSILGIDAPLKPSRIRLMLGVAHLRTLLLSENIETLIDLPHAKDEDTIWKMRLLSSMIVLTYSDTPLLCAEYSVMIVRLCLKQGNTADSPLGYMIFGTLCMGHIFGNYKLGGEFGHLAVRLQEVFGGEEQRAEVYACYVYFSANWNNNPQNYPELYQRVINMSSSKGNVFFSSIVYVAFLQSRLILGLPFSETIYLSEKATFLIKATKDPELLGYILSLRAILLGFSGEGERKVDREFDDMLFEQSLFKPKYRYLAHSYYLCKVLQMYLKGLYSEAEKYLNNASCYLAEALGSMFSVFYYFLEGMVSVELFDTKGKRSYKKKMLKAIKKLKKWALLGNQYSHLLQLLELRMAQKQKSFKEVVRLYTELKDMLDLGSSFFLKVLVRALLRAYVFSVSKIQSKRYLKEIEGVSSKWGVKSGLDYLITGDFLKKDKDDKLKMCANSGSHLFSFT